MVHGANYLALILNTGMLVVLYLFRAQLRGIPGIRLLISSYLLYCAGYVANVADRFCCSGGPNIVAGALDLLCSIALAAWVLALCRPGKRKAA